MEARLSQWTGREDDDSMDWEGQPRFNGLGGRTTIQWTGREGQDSMDWEGGPRFSELGGQVANSW